MLDPAPDGDVVNGEPTFRHHLLQIAICERVSKVPPNAQEDDHVFKMSSAEECWPFSGHDTPYQITSTAFATEPSIEIYLERCRGDIWTLEMKDRQQKDIELFEPFKHDLKKKICIGAVSHRVLQADRPEDVAIEIRNALKYIPPERLIVSSDCGFGRQGCNREIAFYKASAIAQGANIVRRELGLPVTPVPAADPKLQIDIVPGRG